MASPLDEMYSKATPPARPVRTPPAAEQWHEPGTGPAPDFGSLSGDEQMAAIDRSTALAAGEQALRDEEDAEIRARLGAGPPTQFDVAGVAGMRGGQSRAEADAWLARLSAGYTAPSHANPLRPIREQYTGTMGNLLEGQQTNYEHLHDAQVAEAEAHAGAYQQEAARQQAAIDVQEHKAVRDMERRNEALQKSQMVMSKVSAAADRLNESPDIDPNRYWASQSAGRKFGWGLSAALLGFAGLNPTGALQEAISRDIDAQKANFAQKQAGMGARMDEMGASRSVYQDLREAIGDEQATDMAMESARLAQAETAFKAMAAKEGIPVQVAEQNVFLNEWRQRRAELDRGLQELLVATPERIGGGFRHNLTGPDRQLAMKEYERALDRADKFDEMSITQGGQAAQSAAQERIESAKAGAKNTETSKLEYQQRRDYVKDTAPLAEEIRQIEAWRKDYPNDIPGYGSVGWFGRSDLTDAQQKAYRRLIRIVMLRLRPESGAAISDSELDRESNGLIDGKKTENSSVIQEAKEALKGMDEYDVNEMLNERYEEAKSRLDYYGRPQDEGEIDYVHRGQVGPRASIAGSGGRQPDVVRRR